MEMFRIHEIVTTQDVYRELDEDIKEIKIKTMIVKTTFFGKKIEIRSSLKDVSVLEHL